MKAKLRPIRFLAPLLGILILLVASEREEAASPKSGLYVLSNSSPHIVEIDGEANEVVRTADVPGLKRWTWNDDNNLYDGTNLWAGARNPDTGEAEVLLINLDTLQVTARIPVGKETANLYIGKPTKDGRLFVGKHASWQMAIIDIKSRKVLSIVDVPTNGEAVGSPAAATCDSDVSTGADGVERVYYPTRDGDTVVALDSGTAKPLKIASFPNLRPLMLTVAHDSTVWVQEARTNTNSVLDPVTLDVLARFPTPKNPLLASFSPDGKLGYVTGSDAFVSVVDAEKYQVLRNVEVGSDATKAAAHPNGKILYVQVTKENSVAVIDTSTWQVVKRINIGTSPDALFVRAR